MRVVSFILLAFACLTAKAEFPFPIPDGETLLERVQAEPHKFVGSTLSLTGNASIGDYYNYGYSDAKDAYYSLSLRQAKAGTIVGGESCTLYLRRDIGKPVMDLILAKSATSNEVPIHVKAIVDPSRHTEREWSLFELVDAQFPTDDGSSWQPWIIAGRCAALDQQKKKEMAASIESAKLKKEQWEQSLENDRAERTRTWTDKTRKFSVLAEFRGVANGSVLLRKKSGEEIKVQLEKLSEDDKEWLKTRLSKRDSAAAKTSKPSKAE